MPETRLTNVINQIDKTQFVLDAIKRARANPMYRTNKKTAAIDVFYAGHKFPQDGVLFSSENDFNIFQEIPSLATHGYFLSSVDLTKAVNNMDNARVQTIKGRMGSLVNAIADYAQEMEQTQSGYNFFQWLIINHSTISANPLDNNSLLNNEFKLEVIKTFGELPDESITILYRNTLDLYITLNYSSEVFILRSLQQDFLEWVVRLFMAIRESDISYDYHLREFMRLMITDKNRVPMNYEKKKQERLTNPTRQNSTYESCLDFEDWYVLQHSPDCCLYKDPYTRAEITPNILRDMTKYDLVFGKGVKDYSQNQ